MAELRRDEPVLAGVRRILQEWIAESGDSLRMRTLTDARIHDARRRLKKARAALKLLRQAIGESAYRRENAALSDAARPLGVARDSNVSVAVLDGLVKRYAPATRSLQLDKFRRVLRAERTKARQAISVTLLEKQRKALRDISSRVERGRMRGEEWQVIGGGLERVYRRGKKAMKAAIRSRTSEDLHHWRKQVKYLWHQLQILEPACPARLSELVERTHTLADHYLGDDHDLAVLRQKILNHADAFEIQDRDVLIAMLDLRRKKLQDKALKLGARIYEEKPRRFASRIGNHWRESRTS